MSRPYYIEVQDGIFHATSRGIARRTVFEDAEDCRAFIAELRNTVVRYRWQCLIYCMMGNHFHLVVKTPDANLALGMRDLKREYAKRFNQRRGQDGSIWKKGYHPQLIQDDAYLLAAAAYVAQNPVRAGLVERPADWPWSSFADTISGAETFVDPAPILELFSEQTALARRRFAELVHGYGGLPEFDPSVPIFGDDAFVQRYAPPERPGPDIVKRIWEQARPPLAQLAEALDEANFLREARNTHCYTLRQIAEHLGCSDQTVRRRLSR